MARSPGFNSRGNRRDRGEQPPGPAIEIPAKRPSSGWSMASIFPYLAAVVLSLVSFHTTFVGMRSFYGSNRAHGPVSGFEAALGGAAETAFPIALAAIVQAGIFFASAYLSRIFVERASGVRGSGSTGWVRPLVTLILVMLLPISIMFSYAARLDWYVGEEAKARTQAAVTQTEATKLLSEIKGMMDGEHKVLATQIQSRDDYAAWRGNVQTVVDTAAGAKDAIARFLDSKKDELDKKAKAEDAKKLALQNQSAELRQQARALNREIKDLVKQQTELQGVVSAPAATSDLDEKIAALKQQMQDELDGTGAAAAADRPAGEGRVYNRLKGEKEELERQRKSKLSAAEKVSKEADAAMTAVEKKLAEANTKLLAVERDAQKAGVQLDPALKAGDAELADDLATSMTKLRPELGNIVRDGKTALTNLGQTFTLKDFDAAQATCARLVPLAGLPEFATVLQGVNCRPLSLEPAIKSLRDFDGKEAEFAKTCSRLSEQPEDGADGKASVEAINKWIGQTFGVVEGCRKASGLVNSERYGAQLNKLSATVRNAKLERDTKIDYLSFTFDELVRGARPAYYALGIALIVDLLVLVFTFLGELPKLSRGESVDMPVSPVERKQMFARLQVVNDAVETLEDDRLRPVKMLLGNIRPPGSEGLLRLDLNGITNESDRQDVMRRLLAIQASARAWPDPSRPNVIIISERGMIDLAEALETSVKFVAQQVQRSAQTAANAAARAPLLLVGQNSNSAHEPDWDGYFPSMEPKIPQPAARSDGNEQRSSPNRGYEESARQPMKERIAATVQDQWERLFPVGPGLGESASETATKRQGTQRTAPAKPAPAAREFAPVPAAAPRPVFASYQGLFPEAGPETPESESAEKERKAAEYMRRLRGNE